MHVVASKRKRKILEVTNALGDLARAVPRKTGTEKRAACFGIYTWLGIQVAIKDHWLRIAHLLYLELKPRRGLFFLLFLLRPTGQL